MLQSLLALPLGVIVQVLVFLLLYRLTPLNGKQAAAIVALAALAGVFVYSLIDWPGADVLAMYVAVLAVTAYLLGIVSNAREQQAGERGERRWFHWGPAVIVIFFLALFALDGVLVVVSRQGLPPPIAERLLPTRDDRAGVRSAFPGVVARDYQKKESLYNEYLQQVERQEQRGWQLNKGWLSAPRAGSASVFRVQVSERDGAPLQFAEVSGVFERPSDSRLDQPFALPEIEPGVYQADIRLPEPGAWNLVLRVQRGEQLHEVHAKTSIGETLIE